MDEHIGPGGSQEWLDAVEGLPEQHRRSVVIAVADNILSGWNPTRRDVEVLAAVAAGEMSADGYRAHVLAEAGVVQDKCPPADQLQETDP